MRCVYDDACTDVAQPFWVLSVGIPLCERHESRVQGARQTFDHGADPRSLDLLAAVAVLVLSNTLADRHQALAA